MEGWDFGGNPLLDRTNWTRFRCFFFNLPMRKTRRRFQRISVLLKDLRAEKRLTSHRERLDGLWEGLHARGRRFLEHEQPRAG